MTRTDPDEQIRFEQIKAIYTNSQPGVITTLITVTVLTGAMVLIDAAPRSSALVFLSIMWVQSLARLGQRAGTSCCTNRCPTVNCARPSPT